MTPVNISRPADLVQSLADLILAQQLVNKSNLSEQNSSKWKSKKMVQEQVVMQRKCRKNSLKPK